MIRASSLPNREQSSSVQEMQLSWDKSRQLNEPWTLIQEVGKMLCERITVYWPCPLICRSLSEKACRWYHHLIWIWSSVGIAMRTGSSLRTITNKTNSISSATRTHTSVTNSDWWAGLLRSSKWERSKNCYGHGVGKGKRKSHYKDHLNTVVQPSSLSVSQEAQSDASLAAFCYSTDRSDL